MCFGGGGGGKTNRALEEQNRILQEQVEEQRRFNEELIARQEAEAAEREGRIGSATGAVNRAFSNRDDIFNRLRSATFRLNRNELEDARDTSRRDTKFALARAGTLGGSVDVDKNRDIEDKFNQGILNAQSFAQSSADSLRSREDQIRNALLAIAGSGNVSGSQLSPQIADALRGTQAAASAPSVIPNISAPFAQIAQSIGNLAVLSGLLPQSQTAVGSPDEFSGFNINNPGRRFAGTES